MIEETKTTCLDYGEMDHTETTWLASEEMYHSDDAEDTKSEPSGARGESKVSEAAGIKNTCLATKENVEPQISTGVHLAFEKLNEEAKHHEDWKDEMRESPGVVSEQEFGNESVDKHLVPTSTVVHLTLEELDARFKRERAEMEKLVMQERKEVGVLMKSLVRQQGVSDIPVWMQAMDVEDQIEEENVQEEWQTTSETVYTMMYICSIRSQSFCYAVVVYITQMATISLTLMDVLDPESDDNPLQLPAMVDPTVTCAQAVTLFMALAYQSDLIEAVLKLQDGFHPELLERHPGADFLTWIISCVAQLMAGLLLLVTIFILTMQVDSVLAIMLNFAALHFMAEIDDYGFALATMGFITNQIQREVQSVVVKIPSRPTRNRSRRILYFLSLAGLFVGYGMLKARQLSGEYLPTFVYVQFGDAYNPSVPHFSGTLTSGNVRAFAHRQYTDVETGHITLGYCKEERSWTFSEAGDPCIYFAKSHETDSYDVTKIPGNSWRVFDSTGRLRPFESFSLVSRDCNPMTCKGECGSNGLCECPHDRFGMDCALFDVCPELVIDRRLEPFPPARINFDLVSVSDTFNLLQNDDTEEYVKVNHMPVYYSNTSFPANVLFFGGRRWVLISEWDWIYLTEATLDTHDKWFFKNRTVAILQNDFHGGNHQTPIFISDPVNLESPDFHPTPVGLTWWTVELQNNLERHYAPDVPLETQLVCHKPPPSCIGKTNSFCGTGECNLATGLCECSSQSVYYGGQCELIKPCTEHTFPCLGNGHCDGKSEVCHCKFPYYGKACESKSKCFEKGGKCPNGGVCNETSGECNW